MHMFPEISIEIFYILCSITEMMCIDCVYILFAKLHILCSCVIFYFFAKYVGSSYEHHQ